jgi:hypothetical protein
MANDRSDFKLLRVDAYRHEGSTNFVADKTETQATVLR